jgi:hypothetical protein
MDEMSMKVTLARKLVILLIRRNTADLFLPKCNPWRHKILRDKYAQEFIVIPLSSLYGPSIKHTIMYTCIYSYRVNQSLTFLFNGM